MQHERLARDWEQNTCGVHTATHAEKRHGYEANCCKCIFETTERSVLFNLLKPTGHVMHIQFNIQQLYALPTLYLCVLYLSENKQRLVPLTA